MIGLTVAAAALGAWLYLLFARGGFWLVKEPEVLPTPGPPLKSIAVIIPARDEASVVGPAIQSLLAQNYAGPVHIFLVDDESSDGTADVARQAAQRAGSSGELTTVRSSLRPPGWTGKLWALSQGLQAARGFPADYYLFTDADVVHDPANLAQLVARADTGFELVSLMVELRCQSFAERAIIPAFVFFFFMLYPPSWIRRTDRRTAAAAGGCILIRREALDRIGGIASIQNELIDDCALARKVKQKGGRVWMGATRKTRSIREYHSWKELMRMISRNAFTQLSHSTILLGLTCVGMLLTFVVPCLLILIGVPASIFGLSVWLLMSLAFLPTLHYYRRSPLWAPLLPVIALFYMTATFDSAVGYWLGKGGVWKGRVQDPGTSPP